MNTANLARTIARQLTMASLSAAATLGSIGQPKIRRTSLAPVSLGYFSVCVLWLILPKNS